MADKDWKDWKEIEYKANNTVITAQNLNDVQKAIIGTTDCLANGDVTFSVKNEGKATDGAYITYKLNGEEITKKLGSSDGTATTKQVLSGATFSSKEGTGLTGEIPKKGQQVFKPSAEEQTINEGYYLESNQIIRGDPNLIADNIANGVTIFGVTGNMPKGVDTDDATVGYSGQIVEGYSGYSQGKLIEGSFEGIELVGEKKITSNVDKLKPETGKYFSKVEVNVPTVGTGYWTANGMNYTSASNYNSDTKSYISCLLIGFGVGLRVNASVSMSITLSGSYIQIYNNVKTCSSVDSGPGNAIGFVVCKCEHGEPASMSISITNGDGSYGSRIWIIPLE